MRLLKFKLSLLILVGFLCQFTIKSQELYPFSDKGKYGYINKMGKEYPSQEEMIALIMNKIANEDISKYMPQIEKRFKNSDEPRAKELYKNLVEINAIKQGKKINDKN